MLHAAEMLQVLVTQQKLTDTLCDRVFMEDLVLILVLILLALIIETI